MIDFAKKVLEGVVRYRPKPPGVMVPDQTGVWVDHRQVTAAIAKMGEGDGWFDVFKNIANEAERVAAYEKNRAEAAEAEAAALRLKLQAMHRRAQKAEGLSHRSANLLETIMGSVKEAMKPDAKLSLHSLFHRVRAARDHARASSGRAFIEGYYFYYGKLKEAEAERDALRERVARLEGALTEIDALDPEKGYIGACSENAIRGLVLRMGEIARAALTDGAADGK